MKKSERWGRGTAVLQACRFTWRGHPALHCGGDTKGLMEGLWFSISAPDSLLQAVVSQPAGSCVTEQWQTADGTHPQGTSYLIFAALVTSLEMFSTREEEAKYTNSILTDICLENKKAKPAAAHLRFKSNRLLLESCLCCSRRKNEHT